MSRKSLWSYGFIMLSLANFLSWLSYNMVYPVLVEHALSRGASAPFAGFIAGAFAFASLLTRPFAGIVTDSMDRKRLLSGSAFLSAFFLLLCALSSSPGMIFLFRCLQGCMFGFYTTACLASLGFFSSGKELSKAIGYYSLFQVVSMAIGPAAGLWVADHAGTAGCLYLGVACQAFAALATQLVPKEKIRNVIVRRKLSPSSFFEVKILRLSFVYLTFTLMYGIVSAYLVVSAKAKGAGNPDLHFIFNAAVLFLVRVLLSDKLDGEHGDKLMVVSFAAAVLALALLGSGTTTLMFVLAGVFKAIAQGISQPLLMSRSLDLVPPERKGVASSTIYIGGDMGQAVAPMIGGAVLGSVGYTVMYDMFIVPLLAGFAVFMLYERKGVKR